MNPNGGYKMTLLEELQVARPGLKSAVLWVGVIFSSLEIAFLDRNLKNKAGGGFFWSETVIPLLLYEIRPDSHGMQYR